MSTLRPKAICSLGFDSSQASRLRSETRSNSALIFVCLGTEGFESGLVPVWIFPMWGLKATRGLKGAIALVQFCPSICLLGKPKAMALGPLLVGFFSCL